LSISETSICNSALSKIGADRILSLDDNTAQGRLCKEQYAKLRDSLLMEHPWNFAVGRKELGLSTFKPAFKYDNAFEIPNDCLRILECDFNEYISIGADRPWDVEIDPDTENKYLVTNESSVKILYIKSVLEARFTAMFAEVLAYRLAMEFAYPLTQSASLVEDMTRKYMKALADCRSFDGAEGSLKQVQADDWLYARY